jgi:AmmeMemoRadiSam system protein B/AmmeMemoRadiSam system protein A
METYSQNIIADRQPYAAGKFYSADKAVLDKDLTELFSKCTKSPSGERVRAIISPHAGYVFSGETAAAAFSSIPPDARYDNIFIIGSSHVMSFDGASVYYLGDLITPLGKLKVNKEIAEKLRENDVFKFPVTAHMNEHSLEVQLPLIQHYFKNIPQIVPVIIGTNNLKTIKQIANALQPWFNPRNLFVISSDFSHYPPYKDAVETDKKTAASIISGNPDQFLGTLKENSSKHIKGLATSMCGWTSGLTLLYLSEKDKSLKYHVVDYSNSGDSKYGGSDEVVGYNAITLSGGIQEKDNEISDFSFTQEEKGQLFKIARNSISEKLEGQKISGDDEELSPKLMEPMGAFVTLRINGVLRGCIGRFFSSEPLCEVVRASAISSAFDDPRFPSLTREEYAEAKLEITVLGPLKKINDVHEIILGKHGIYIKKGMNSGTMLPQVATENN